MARNKSLKTGLIGKASELRNKEETQAQAAQNFLAASAAAKAESATASTHADAVERALLILEEAGVSI